MIVKYHLIHMENKFAELPKGLKDKKMKFLIKSTVNYTIQLQNQVFYTVFVKSTKVLLIWSHLFVLYCQL